MEYLIELSNSSKDKMILGLLKELGVKTQKVNSGKSISLTAKDVGFGIGRKAKKSELVEYISRVENSESLDIDSLILSLSE